MASPTSEAKLPDIATVADSCFLTSHRLTEWVSNAPSMEEDVAIGNIALDLLGQARGLYAVLGDEDELAYFRDAPDWRNLVICELPNGDFGQTMLRLLFVSEWLAVVWRSLAGHDDLQVRGVAEKALKENAYHRRHATTWVTRLGDGTEESHRRMALALDALTPWLADLAGPQWLDAISPLLEGAGLDPLPPLPEVAVTAHTEHLSALLTEMQSLARAHPGATW
jgi:ring-1,2-phenylacetyl-CoA epoxidase subunit PaaC